MPTRPRRGLFSFFQTAIALIDNPATAAQTSLVVRDQTPWVSSSICPVIPGFNSASAGWT